MCTKTEAHYGCAECVTLLCGACGSYFADLHRDHPNAGVAIPAISSFRLLPALHELFVGVRDDPVSFSSSEWAVIMGELWRCVARSLAVRGE